MFYAAGGNAKQDSFELDARKRLSLHLEVHAEQGHGENVVGILEGGDPSLKDEYVVLSAHLDHLGLSAPQPDGHNVFNGADDDASGCAGMLAIARAFAEGAAKGMRPKRSILFLWMGGEEKGLWGSQYFLEFPPIDVGKIVVNLNLDMIGRTKSPNSVDNDATHVLVNPGEVLLVGPNISSDDLEQTIEKVNGAYRRLKLNHFYDVTAPDATHDNLGPRPNGQRIFYRSDHYNFAKMGIPIAFFTTGLHVDYHRPTDTPEKIDYQEMQQISQTVAAISWEWQPARAAQAEHDSARAVDQGHEDNPDARLGQGNTGFAAAAWGTVLRAVPKQSARDGPRRPADGRRTVPHPVSTGSRTAQACSPLSTREPLPICYTSSELIDQFKEASY